MSKQVTTSQAKLFIGLDIHKKTWKFHVATDIVLVSGHSFPPCARTIEKYVSKNYKEYAVSVAYEAGCCGYNPARAFISYGWNTYVFNPADIPRPAKNNFVKTDKIDAKNIALQLRSGHLKKLIIPRKEREALRCLTRQLNSWGCLDRYPYRSGYAELLQITCGEKFKGSHIQSRKKATFKNTGSN